jgi:hypothetical protein
MNSNFYLISETQYIKYFKTDQQVEPLEFAMPVRVMRESST